jgi:hypothetical protein
MSPLRLSPDRGEVGTPHPQIPCRNPLDHLGRDIHPYTVAQHTDNDRAALVAGRPTAHVFAGAGAFVVKGGPVR